MPKSWYDQYKIKAYEKEKRAEKIAGLPKCPGVYRLICYPVCKSYIGATHNIYERVRAHLLQMMKTNSVHPMGADFKRYRGLEEIGVVVLAVTNDVTELKLLEEICILYAVWIEGRELYNRIGARNHPRWEK